jgi:hypothetical protein
MRKRHSRIGVPVLLAAGAIAIAGCGSDPAEAGAQPGAEQGSGADFCTVVEERGDELAAMTSGTAEEEDAAREAMREISAAAPAEIKQAVDTIVDMLVNPDGTGINGEEGMTKLSTAADQVDAWLSEHCDADVDLGVGGVSGE